MPAADPLIYRQVRSNQNLHRHHQYPRDPLTNCPDRRRQGRAFQVRTDPLPVPQQPARPARSLTAPAARPRPASWSMPPAHHRPPRQGHQATSPPTARPETSGHRVVHRLTPGHREDLAARRCRPWQRQDRRRHRCFLGSDRQQPRGARKVVLPAVLGLALAWRVPRPGPLAAAVEARREARPGDKSGRPPLRGCSAPRGRFAVSSPLRSRRLRSGH